MGKNSNISDKDILKEETQPGVVVYRSNVPEGAGVFDMDIAPGIKEVTIKYDLLMLGCEKSFPDVEKLIICEDVVSIEILNTLFPNVRWVLSMNYEFETGSYLVYNHFGFKTLLNAFCRGADETIDLGDIDSIDNFAFKGCESLNIIGGEDIKDWQAIEPEAFSESALKSQPWHITQDGVYADINVQISSIPKDFIFGFVEQDVSSDAGTNICVHLKNQTEDFKFILPDAIRSNSNYSKMNFALNDFANHPESSKKVLNEGFLMASTAKSVDITAYKTYKLTKSQRAKEFIRDNSDDIAFSFARMMPEKDFVDFVKLDFVKLKYSERLAEQLRKNEWATGMAYMLEATEADEKSGQKNFAI